MEKYKHDAALIILVIGAAYTVGVFAEAPENGYWAGQTLDPACAPGEAHCLVQTPWELDDHGYLYSDHEGIGLGTKDPEAKLDVRGTFQSLISGNGFMAGMQISDNLFGGWGGFLGPGIGSAIMDSSGEEDNSSAILTTLRNHTPLIQLSTVTESLAETESEQGGIRLDATGPDTQLNLTLTTDERNKRSAPLSAQLIDTRTNLEYGLFARPVRQDLEGSIQIGRYQQAEDGVYYADRMISADDSALRFSFFPNVNDHERGVLLNLSENGAWFQSNQPEYVARFQSTRANADGKGIQIRAGGLIPSENTYYLSLLNGAGDETGFVADKGGTIGFYAVEDERPDVNVADTQMNALEIIKGLRVVDLKRYKDPQSVKTAGFVAEEVQSIYPQMVMAGPNGYLGIMREALVPVLTKAIQDLDVRIENLENSPCSSESKLFDRMILWFGEATNTINGLFTDTLHAKTQICIEDVCVDKAKLQELINAQQANVSCPAVPAQQSVEGSAEVQKTEELSVPSEPSIQEEVPVVSETPQAPETPLQASEPVPEPTEQVPVPAE